MLSVFKLSSSAEAATYYKKADYYTKGEDAEDIKSVWLGEGAERLGLTGAVDPIQFRDLLDGKLPDGVQLGAVRNGTVEHTPGWDLTFSAPKSVSILALLGGDKRLLDAHHNAVLSMSKLVEERYMVGRRNLGAEGVGQIKLDEMVAGLFTHSTSRDLDPQLHSHMVLLNMGKDANGKDMSLHSKKIYEDKMFLGQIYRNELAKSVQSLGYSIDYDTKKGTFEIAGVPKDVIDEYSSRRKTIEAVADMFGYEGGKALEKAALRSRDPKRNVPRDQVLNDWASRLAEHGHTPDSLLNVAYSMGTGLSSETPSDRPGGDGNVPSVVPGDRPSVDGIVPSVAPGDRPSVDDIVPPVVPGDRPSVDGNVPSVEPGGRPGGDVNVPNATPESLLLPPKQFPMRPKSHTEIAVEVLNHYESVFTYKDVVQSALRISKGAASLSDIEGDMRVLLEKGKMLRSDKDPALYTTSESVRRENYMVDLLGHGIGKHSPIASVSEIDRASAAYNFTDGQARGFKALLSSNDRYIGIEGYAGVGKTYMAKPAIALAKQAGYSVRGLAPYGTQVDALQSETGLESNTLKSHLVALETGTYKSEGNELWWVDEAGTVNAKDMADLMTHAHKLNARVVFAGDRKQLGAIEAGNPFSLLITNGMESALNDTIVRQTNENLRQAVYDIIDKKTESAFKRLEKDMTESASPVDDLVRAYLAKEDGSFSKVAMIIPDIKTRDEANSLVRAHFREKGMISGDEVSVANYRPSKIDGPMKRHAFFYEKGQVVRFNRDLKSIGVKTNEYMTVESVRNDTVVLRREDGTTFDWEPGKIGGGERVTTTYEKTDFDYAEGDRIRWKDKTKDLDLKNGMVGIVKRIEGQTMVIDFNGTEKTVDLLNNTHRHFELAYAQTVHSIQGQTFQEAMVLAESWRVNLVNQSAFYVAVSRAKESAHIFTDDQEKLKLAIDTRLGAKESALDNITKSQADSLRSDPSRKVDLTRDHDAKALLLPEKSSQGLEKDRIMDF